MQCIAFATADQYHLPTLCHDLIANGFYEIDNLPRGNHICFMAYNTVIQFLGHTPGWLCNVKPTFWQLQYMFILDASNVLVICTEMASKPGDNALIFFFRYVLFFHVKLIMFIFWLIVLCLNSDRAIFIPRDGSVVFWNVEEKTVRVRISMSK